MPKNDYLNHRQRKLYSKNQSISKKRSYNPYTLTKDQAWDVLKRWHQHEVEAMATGNTFESIIQSEPIEIRRAMHAYHQIHLAVVMVSKDEYENVIESFSRYLEPFLRKQRDDLFTSARLATAGYDKPYSVLMAAISEMPSEIRDATSRYYRDAKTIKDMTNRRFTVFSQRKNRTDQCMLARIRKCLKHPMQVIISGYKSKRDTLREIDSSSSVREFNDKLQEMISDADRRDLLCPITGYPFQTPVEATDGKIYELSAIQSHMQEKMGYDLESEQRVLPQSPVTGEALELHLVHKPSIMDEINKLIQDKNDLFDQNHHGSSLAR